MHLSRALSVIVVIAVLLSGCQINDVEKSTPESAVQQFLDSIENQDQALFVAAVEPTSKEASFADFVDSYFADAIGYLGVQLGDISFEDLVLRTTYLNENAATVSVRGYIVNQATGEKLSFDKDISTSMHNGTWMVDRGNLYQSQALLFLPHEIQKVPSTVQGKTKWTFIGSIQNSGSEAFVGDWPTDGTVSTKNNTNNLARIEFFCPENINLSTPNIPLLFLSPGSFTRGIWGCNLAVVVEVDWNTEPKTLAMDNFKVSDLTSVKPVPVEKSTQASFPDYVEIPGGPEIVFEGISTRTRQEQGNYFLDLVLYVRLNYQVEEEMKYLDDIYVNLRGSNGQVVKLNLSACGNYTSNSSQSVPGLSVTRKFCVPLTQDFFNLLQVDNGYTLYVYLPDTAILRTYWIDLSPKLIISDEPMQTFVNVIENNQIYPQVQTGDTVNWNIAQSIILSGYCQRVLVMNNSQIRIYLKDNRFVVVLNINRDTLQRLVAYCGQSCAGISVDYEQVIITSPPKPTPIPPPPAPGSVPTGYLIVVSAFGHYDKAVTFNQRWVEAGFPVVIYYRNGYYRNTLYGFRTREEVDSALPRARNINENAYIVELPDWCPNPTRTANYIACGVITQSNDSGSVSPSISTNEIGPASVWKGDYVDCMNSDRSSMDCIVSVMKQAGASPEAINFVNKYKAILDSFYEKGKVDVGTVFYPDWANDNIQSVFLNGSPPVIFAMDVNDIDITKDPGYQTLIRKYPNAFLWSTVNSLQAENTLPTGGQRFVVSYFLYNGCHACGIVGYAYVNFDFDSRGNFLGTKLSSLSSQ